MVCFKFQGLILSVLFGDTYMVSLPGMVPCVHISLHPHLHQLHLQHCTEYFFQSSLNLPKMRLNQVLVATFLVLSGVSASPMPGGGSGSDVQSGSDSNTQQDLQSGPQVGGGRNDANTEPASASDTKSAGISKLSVASFSKAQPAANPSTNSDSNTQSGANVQSGPQDQKVGPDGAGSESSDGKGSG